MMDKKGYYNLQGEFVGHEPHAHDYGNPAKHIVLMVLVTFASYASVQLAIKILRRQVKAPSYIPEAPPEALLWLHG